MSRFDERCLHQLDVGWYGTTSPPTLDVVGHPGWGRKGCVLRLPMTSLMMIHLILDPLLIQFGTSLQTETYLHWISPAWVTNTHLCGHPPEVNGPFFPSLTSVALLDCPVPDSAL